MPNVNCPLCKGAIWIPIEKAAEYDKLASLTAENERLRELLNKLGSRDGFVFSDCDPIIVE